MEFDVELAFEGVENRLDQLADGFEQVLTGPGRAVAVGRAQQPHPAFGEEPVALGGDVALIGDDGQAGALLGDRVGSWSSTAMRTWRSSSFGSASAQ